MTAIRSFGELKSLGGVYMLGIGGIGMSALARFLRKHGLTVRGYDRTQTPLTAELQNEGIKIDFDFDSVDYSTAQLLIYTPALKRNWPVFAMADERKIPVMKRAEILGLISREYKTIAIAGTHGKTTTSALTTHLLRSSGIALTAFVGGIMKNYNSNFVFGESEWMLCEADEFDRSFLQLNPDVAVITAVDSDHPDIYGTGADMLESYSRFASCIKPGGRLLVESRLQSFAQGLAQNALFYGLEAGNFMSCRLRQSGLHAEFDYVADNETFKSFTMTFPGRHNVINATAAIAVARYLGASESGIRKGLNSFLGIKRRFDVRFSSENLIHIDDYAHHPEEIRALLVAVREMFPGRKILVIFQPHLYSRTRDFTDGFAETLSLADALILLEIYPAREEPVAGVSSRMVFDLVKTRKKELTGKEGLMAALRKFKMKEGVVLTVGAGDIDTKVEDVAEEVAAW